MPDCTGWETAQEGDVILLPSKWNKDKEGAWRMVLDENYMMSMFSKYVDTLPPFKEYWEHLFEKKKMIVVSSESGARVLQFAELRNELFSPKDPTNAATNECLVQLAKEAAQGVLDELHNEKKTTWKYLSISGSSMSYQGCPPNVQNE
jgi:hypothetical protein